MKRSRTGCLACCLSCAASLATLVLAQLPLVPPPAHDALPLAAFPPFPPTAPGLDVRAEWDALVSAAKAHARAELDKERDEQGEQEQEQPKRASGEGKGGIKVVRETFYVPLGQEEKKGPLEAAASEAKSAAQVVGSAAVKEVVEEEPADIVKTVSKLKALNPIFTYAVHHPLRFLYRYALLPLLYSFVFLLSTLLSLLLSALQLLLTPLHFTFLVFASPFSTFLDLASATLPLWATLLGAILAGSGLGAVAGLVAGRTTREIIDETVDTARRGLVWLGVLSKKGAAPVSEETSTVASSPGATFESISNFGTSRARARGNLGRDKGKQRASFPSSSAFSSDLPSSSSGSPTPASMRAFNPIVPSLSSSSALPRAPTRSSRFSTSSSASALPARFSKYTSQEGEFADPPSEELDPEGEGEKKTKGGKGGWRGRKVDW
ncbi:hypothetical protein JCM8097_007568 [Rhodosporidiobolus ruineniae]